MAIFIKASVIRNSKSGIKIITIGNWLGNSYFRLGNVSLLMISGGGYENHSIRATPKAIS